MKLLLILFFSLSLGSCDKQQTYNLIVSNRGIKTIDEVKVWYGDKFISHGIVSPASSSTNAGAKPKLKDKIKISWVDSKNQYHEQFFKTFDSIPEKYDKGNVIFAYIGNGKFILEFYMPKNDFPKLFDE